MKKLLVIFMILLVATGYTFAAGKAEVDKTEPECTSRGLLDVGFCDEDGDLVADAPKNEANIKDPDVLFFTYTPLEDPAVYVDMFRPFLDYIEEVTGKEVRYFPTQSYAAEIEAMRSGRLQIAGVGTGPTCFAVNLAGFVPFAVSGTDEGKFGYKLQIITPIDSDIYTLEDLKGRTVAHTEESSNSGNMAPRALLPEVGIVPGEDYEVVYSGGHGTSILGVYNKDYEAACIANLVMERMHERGEIDMNQIRVIYNSDPFPPTAYGYPNNLSAELKANIQKAFFTYRFAGTPLGEEWKGLDGFVPITYKEHWAPIRTIQEAVDTKYTFDNVK